MIEAVSELIYEKYLVNLDLDEKQLQTFKKFINKVNISCECAYLSKEKNLNVLVQAFNKALQGFSCIHMLNAMPQKIDKNAFYLIEDKEAGEFTAYWYEKGEMRPHKVQADVIPSLSELFVPGRSIEMGTPQFAQILSLCGYAKMKAKIDKNFVNGDREEKFGDSYNKITSLVFNSLKTNIDLLSAELSVGRNTVFGSNAQHRTELQNKLQRLQDLEV